MNALIVSLAVAAPRMDGSTASTPDPWERTLDVVKSGVVSIRMDGTRPFDTEWTTTSQATGFVVDAKRGIILTNRHVVLPGPVTAKAVFVDHEEVPLVSLYRDPVHDFGFYQYDPASLEFAEPAELPLVPSAARVGAEIRVVGNDAGEKLSFLAGTIARLDREAPTYSSVGFNDFNTFYFQAASGTSGGSSGSPVVDVGGRVIALNAGGSTSAASSYYLPLDRVVRALGLIQAGNPVSRGTLAADLAFTHFDELRRLGLSATTEAEVRAEDPDGTGMLVFDRVLPEGPVDGRVEVGDILVRVDGRPIRGFVPLEAFLDDHVGARVPVEVERGGKRLTVEVQIGDLHAITPSSYVEVGGAVLHDLSYMQARNHNLPARGVYVAGAGYVLEQAGIPIRAIITDVAGTPTPDARAFERVVAALPDGARVPVRFFEAARPDTSLVRTIDVDRTWFPMRWCDRRDGERAWACRASAAPRVSPAPSPQSTTFPSESDRLGDRALRSLVTLQFDIPFAVDGVPSTRYYGVGLVVDAARGLVVTDRNSVPILLGDLRLRFAGDIEIPASVAWLHPVHGIAVLRYDPALIGSTDVRSAVLGTRDVDVGDELRLLGRRASEEVYDQEHTVSTITGLQLPVPVPGKPRFRETNLEAVYLNGGGGVGGVLLDKRGDVAALWGTASYDDGGNAKAVSLGYPAPMLRRVLEDFETGGARGLEVELRDLSLADARELGLPSEEVALLSGKDQNRRVLQVIRVTGGSPADGLVRGGDLLLAVNGAPVSSRFSVESEGDVERAKLRLLRDGRVIEVEVSPRTLPGAGSTRVVVWAGAYVQEVPYEAAQSRGAPRTGVYVDSRFRGSPSMRSGLGRAVRIIQVDDRPVANLDDFLSAVRGRAHGQAVRIVQVDLLGRKQVATVEMDLDYWPTSELRLADGAWRRSEVP